MTTRTLIRRSLRYYWRTHLGIVLGSAVATTVLLGALLVGDSVRGSLREIALARLGDTQLAMAPRGRFFGDGLAGELAGELGVTVVPVLELRGSAESPGGLDYTPNVRILGVDERFWNIGRSGPPSWGLPEEPRAGVNERLARAPGMFMLQKHPALMLTIEKPGALSREAPLTTDETEVTRARLGLFVLSRDDFGRFDLRANQVAQHTVFVPLKWLQKKAGMDGRANVLLVGGAAQREVTLDEAAAALRKRFTLDDAQAELRVLPDAANAKVLELRSRRVFLDSAVVEAALKADAPALGVLTYLANEIRTNGASIPYSMVSAVGFLRAPEAGEALPDDPAWTAVPADMGADQVVISSWLADKDLRAAARPIRQIRMSYYVPAPGGRLEVAWSGPLAVRAVRATDEPPSSPAAVLMQELMPKIPTLPERPTLKDLKLGTRIDKKVIERNRERLDSYWFKYHGTPKAFLTLRAGRELWVNRFGDLTAVRFGPRAENAVRQAVKQHLDPAALGFFFEPVREQALAAGAQGTDFGQLFMGLSFFLIVAAVLLLGLLFVFAIRQRSGQAGLLLAVGFTPRRLRRLLLAEGAILAAIGAGLGTAAAVGYTYCMLAWVASIWQGTGQSAVIEFHAGTLTFVVGIAASVAVAILAMWLALHRQASRPARELVAGTSAGPAFRGAAVKRRLSLAVSFLASIAALWILVNATSLAVGRAAGAFFASGALLLLAGLGGSYAALCRGGGRTAAGRLTLSRLGMRNAGRRRWRSLATIGLLACGSFVVVAVGAFRHDPLTEADKPSSGTGGFELYGVSSLPVLHDLNAPEGRKALGLGDADMAGVKVMPLRVRDGEDASCMNLNRTRRPRLLGAEPTQLDKRGAFTFAKAESDPREAWLLLNEDLGRNVVPAVADQTTIEWALHKGLGDTLEFRDDAGRPFKVRIVGALRNSILQGSLIISEKHFLARFGGVEGHRAFLIDAPPGEADRVRSALLSETSSLRRLGLELTPTTERLSAFTRVENTYISIFQLLGGLGLLLGAVAVGIVVLRNALERRSELALLRAVGFSGRSLLGLLVWEHWLLLVSGLICGAAAGVVAVLPALRSAGGEVPLLSLGLTLAAVLATGILWVYLAARFSVRGRLLAALRSE